MLFAQKQQSFVGSDNAKSIAVVAKSNYAARLRAIRTLNTQTAELLTIHTRQGRTFDEPENISIADITQIVAHHVCDTGEVLLVLLDFRENGFIEQDGDELTVTIGADKIGVWMDEAQLPIHAKFFPRPLRLIVNVKDSSRCHLSSIAQLLD